MNHLELIAEVSPPQDEIELAVEHEIVRMLPEGFCVHDADSASWVVRRVVEARGYAERVKQWAEA